jgi:myo-inositol-1(or 4)-monophosphatase
VEEAGGKVTDHEGNKFSVYQHRVLATNGNIHDEMVAIINNRREL